MRIGQRATRLFRGGWLRWPMRRRTLLAGLPATVLLSGCMDLITGDKARFEAQTAVVADDVASDTGYQEKSVRTDRIERTFEQVDRTVVVINSMAEYARSVTVGPLSGELARFTALATPKITIVPGQPANPVDDMDNKALAEMVQSEYSDVSNVQHESDREVQMLGDAVQISKFSARARTQSGESVDVYIHIGQTDNEDDFVIAVGVHPQELDDQDEVDQLVGGIQHPA